MIRPVRVRPEEQQDRDGVRAVHAAAFGSSAEAGLADMLRQQAHPVVSLVAVEESTVAGHIMFSPVTLLGHPELKIMGLAPMAVAPGYQRKGIGSALARAGLKRCKELGFGAVVVLGHPEYYPRFGFSPASRFGIGCDYDVPSEAFMLIELQPGLLNGASGKIEYHSAFKSL